MSHMMANGKPCALPDDHKGQHRAATGAERQARYKRTARGMLADLRYEAKQRGSCLALKPIVSDDLAS